MNKTGRSITATICDDQESMVNMIAEALRAEFQRHNIFLQIDKYTQPLNFLKRVKEKEYQLVFLDIDMPKMNGIDVGVRLKKLQERASLIFVSNYEGRVFESFQAQPFGFIRKSNFLDDVEKLVKLYLKRMQTEESGAIIDLKVDGKIEKIFVEDILYIESQQDMQAIYLKDERSMRARYKMHRFEENLREKGFLRVHHGFLVNYRYITRIGKNEVELINGSLIPVSRNKKVEFLRAFMQLERASNVVIFD